MDSLKNSSYQPLAEVALKVNMELYYHLLHWKTWFNQLMKAGGEARTRMESAIGKVLADFEGVITLGPLAKDMAEHGLIEPEEVLKQRWLLIMKPVFESINLAVSEADLAMKNGNGRIGEHTADLDAALATLSEVYNINPAASW